jgi:hypothetical protein
MGEFKIFGFLFFILLMHFLCAIKRFKENNTRSIASDNKSSNDKSSVMPLALVSWDKRCTSQVAIAVL